MVEISTPIFSALTHFAFHFSPFPAACAAASLCWTTGTPNAMAATATLSCVLVSMRLYLANLCGTRNTCITSDGRISAL